MRHPIEKYNQDQADALASLPQDQRASMARFFRIGNASYRYYQRATDLLVFSQSTDSTSTNSLDGVITWLEQQTTTLRESSSARELLTAYFEEYLEGLPHEGLRRTMVREGLDKAKTSIPFLRYLLERHDIGMDEFLRLNLSVEDYAYYVECSKPLENKRQENL